MKKILAAALIVLVTAVFTTGAGVMVTEAAVPFTEVLPEEVPDSLPDAVYFVQRMTGPYLQKVSTVRSRTFLYHNPFLPVPLRPPKTHA